MYKALLLPFVFQATLSAGQIESGVCQPYFVSLKSKETNLHVGPGPEYGILVKYVLKSLPVLIVAKYDHWRKIRDVDGVEGWIHKSLLSNERYVLVNVPATYLCAEPSVGSSRAAMLKQNVTMKLLAINGAWCNAKTKYRGHTYIGWLPLNAVFGILDSEMR
jgi:SH3-like domain-containing protein